MVGGVSDDLHGLQKGKGLLLFSNKKWNCRQERGQEAKELSVPIDEVARIAKRVKTLILEIMVGNSSAHIREIHLQVTGLRPNTVHLSILMYSIQLIGCEGFEPRGRTG